MLMPISFSTLHAHQRFHFHFRIITDCGSRIYAARPVWEAEPLVLPILMLTMMMMVMIMVMMVMIMLIIMMMMTTCVPPTLEESKHECRQSRPAQISSL